MSEANDEVVTLGDDDERMAADWQEILARHQEDPEPAPAVDEPKEKTAPQRVRDEAGKFAKAAEDDSAAEPAAGDEQAASGQKAQQGAAADASGAGGELAADQPARDLANAPSSWKPAAKAKWEALDPDVRAEIARREGDFLKGQSELLPDAQFGRNMRGVVEPYRMLIESEGATPELAVRDLLRTAAILRVGTPQQKTAAMQQVIRQYGVPMPGPEDQQLQGGQEGQQQFRDPRVDAMLAQQERERAQASERQQSTVLNDIDTFRNAVDAGGKKVYAYFANVENDMVPVTALVRQEHPDWPNQQVLKEAYERAVWANPETRQLVQQKNLSELEATRREENLRKASEAKKAGSVNLPRRAGRTTQGAAIPKFGTPEADALMLENWRQITSG